MFAHVKPGVNGQCPEEVLSEQGVVSA
jgi:hypothetical protein